MALEKRKSKIHGTGIFTTSPIRQGQGFYQIPLEIIHNKPKPKCARIADGKYVDDEEVLNWVNHSCSPNSKLDITEKKPVLVALRDIIQDEEITADYSTTEVEGKRIPCHCGSRNCKGYLLH